MKDYTLFKNLHNNHWTHFLNEAGTITKRGDKQVERLLQMIELKKQFHTIELEYKIEQSELESIAEKAGWTIDEINYAMDKSTNILKENKITSGNKTKSNHILYNGE